MKSLAEALVYAVSYINTRPDPKEEFMDSDTGALESIAGFLSEATEDEKNALADAAKRALPAGEGEEWRTRWQEDVATWMEDMFVMGWKGNARCDD